MEKYLEKLVRLLTEEQLDLFNRIYPNGPTKKQLPHAIDQVERTLIQLNNHVRELRNVREEFQASTIEAEKQIKALKRQLEDTERELRAEQSRRKALENPINTANANVQRRLDKLAALEDGGVDNWDWYGECMSTLNDPDDD